MEALVSKIKGKKTLIIVLIIFAIFVFVFTCLSIIVSKEIIFPNVKIQGIDVGNLSKSHAREKISQHFKDTLDNRKLLLSKNDRIWEYTYSDFEARFDVDNSIQSAYSLGKEGNIFSRIKSYLTLKNKGENIPLKIALNPYKVKKTIDFLAEDIKEEAVDAKISYEDGVFIITPEISGTSLQEKEAEIIITEGLENLTDKTINLPIDRINPKITEAMLKNIKEKISGFTTKFNKGNKERTENLQIASDMIDGKVLLSGEVFSTYEMIGPVTNDNGYKNAPVIVNGQLENDVGGGVCQVATNVYNAAVRSNLEIVERRHHSFPVSYVTIGQDATIAGDWIDMKFKNTRNYPIYIQMYLSGDNLITNIYGDKEGSTERIELETDILTEIPPTISYIEDSSKFSDYKKVEKESKTGYKVNVYKVSYDNGLVIKKELLHNDYYKPVDGVIIVGSKEKEVKSENIKKPDLNIETETEDQAEEIEENTE
jgi:vancomycin resistance protein YoaR